jgi:hypothetical protein
VLVKDPEAFEAFVQLTQYYTKVCPHSATAALATP